MNSCYILFLNYIVKYDYFIDNLFVFLSWREMEDEARKSARITSCRANRPKGGSDPAVGEVTTRHRGRPRLDRVVEETTVSPVVAPDLVSEMEGGQKSFF